MPIHMERRCNGPADLCPCDQGSHRHECAFWHTSDTDDRWRTCN